MTEDQDRVQQLLAIQNRQSDDADATLLVANLSDGTHTRRGNGNSREVVSFEDESDVGHDLEIVE